MYTNVVDKNGWTKIRTFFCSLFQSSVRNRNRYGRRKAWIGSSWPSVLHCPPLAWCPAACPVPCQVWWSRWYRSLFFHIFSVIGLNHLEFCLLVYIFIYIESSDFCCDCWNVFWCVKIQHISSWFSIFLLESPESTRHFQQWFLYFFVIISSHQNWHNRKHGWYWLYRRIDLAPEVGVDTNHPWSFTNWSWGSSGRN